MNTELIRNGQCKSSQSEVNVGSKRSGSPKKNQSTSGPVIQFLSKMRTDENEYKITMLTDIF